MIETKGIVMKYCPFYCIQETYVNIMDRHYLSVKRWEKISQQNGLKKQAGVAILISDKI